MARVAAAGARGEPAVKAARPLHSQRGVALVMVLWLVVLLGVIAASHSRNVRLETGLAFNQLEAARARALADTGLNHAIMGLLMPDIEQPWPLEGSPIALADENGALTVSVRDAHGLVDLNAASAAVLEALLAGAGIDERDRLALVDAILDWRDTDDLRRLQGAEDGDYRLAGMDWGARDGAFASTDELRYVMGMTRELYNRLAPYLTTHSRQAGVKLDYAPAALVAALTGNDEAAGAQRPPPADATKTRATANQARTGTYHIHVQATSPGGARASLQAVVQVTGSADTPYRILSWREPVQAIGREI